MNDQYTGTFSVKTERLRVKAVDGLPGHSQGRRVLESNSLHGVSYEGRGGPDDLRVKSRLRTAKSGALTTRLPPRPGRPRPRVLDGGTLTDRRRRAQLGDTRRRATRAETGPD